jgi:lysophospholipase L1-like esterase
MSWLLRAPFPLALGACVAAIWIQDHTRALPLGLFNENAAGLARLSTACLAAALAALLVLAIDLVRPLRVARALRGALLALGLLELLLYALDVTLVSRGAALALGGPYRELRTPRGEWLFLKKPHAGSPWGFRAQRPFAERAPGVRVLFLGDSYTEGSGSAPACNYPEVAAAELGRRWERPVEALNAGVSGYGPDDARRLLTLLIDRGYRFDAVVFALFLENDFTDNLPATERRAVAGMSFRFPRSAFLRLFHPLNSRSFRYALLVARTAAASPRRTATGRADTGCDTGAAPPAPLDPGLLGYAAARLRRNYAPGAALAEDRVREAIEAMAGEAHALGVPFALVVFPDRVLVDAQLRAALGTAAGGYDLERLRRFALRALAAYRPIDASAALDAGAENYRPGDTHLGDLGNTRVGELVGAALAERLRAPAAPGRPSRP